MTARRLLASAGLMVMVSGYLFAQGAPPKGSTGKCKDDTYTTSAHKKGACSKHGGVTEWYAGTGAGTPPAAVPLPSPKPPAPRPSPAPAPAPTGVAPAGAPAGATAQCNDLTYSMSQHRKGTCSRHKGVKTWLKSVPA